MSTGCTGGGLILQRRRDGEGRRVRAGSVAATVAAVREQVRVVEGEEDKLGVGLGQVGLAWGEGYFFFYFCSFCVLSFLFGICFLLSGIFIKYVRGF